MNDIIEHHGVKGQRWGVRKKRASTTNSSRGASKSKSTTTPSTNHKVLNAILPSSRVQSAITTSLGLAVGAAQYSALRQLGSDRMTALSGSLAKGVLVQVGGNVLSNAILDASRNDTIEHHGVKGQRWGVRKRVSSIRSSARNKKSSDAAASQKKWKKMYANRSKMSTKELQEAVTRLNLENQLAQNISKIPRTRSQRATAAIKKYASTTIKQQVGNIIASQLESYINAAASGGSSAFKEARYRAKNPGFSHMSSAASAAARAAIKK